MPYVAAGVTTAIPAVEGLQPDGGLGALTPRTKETRIGPPGIVVVVRLRHSWVPRVLSYPTAPVGASRPASIGSTCAAIERLLLVRAQRPVALARPTVPAARDVTAPDAECNDNGAGGTAEDAAGRNERPHHHLFRHDSFRCCCTDGPKPVEEDAPIARPHVSQREIRLPMNTCRRSNGWWSHRKEQTNKETDHCDVKRSRKLAARARHQPTGLLELPGDRTARQSMYGCNSFETNCLGVVYRTRRG